MDNLSQQKRDSQIENAKRFNDSDYELDRNMDKSFEKNGYLKSILFFFIGLPTLFLIIIPITALISVYVHWLIAIAISFLGIGMYLFYKKQKKNNSLFIKENLDNIELSTPLYLDLSIILSGSLFFSGLLIVSFGFQIIWMAMLVSLIAIYVYIKAFNKIRFSLFDKIIITKENIKIDDPKSKDTLSINKSDISKLVLLTVKDSSDEKRILEFQFETSDSYKTIEVHETQINDLRLNFDLVIDSLTKLGYILKKETHIVGKLNRIDEQGNQIID